MTTILIYAPWALGLLAAFSAMALCIWMCLVYQKKLNNMKASKLEKIAITACIYFIAFHIFIIIFSNL